MSIVYLNGDYLPLEQARISPLDRGFTFGDGVYEVIPVYQKRIFRLDEHLRRLESSLERIHMTNPLTCQEWQHILQRIVDGNSGEDQSIYLQVTRGVSTRDHFFPEDITATVFVMSRPLARPDSHSGISAITCRDIRWEWCDIKAITLLPSVLLRYEAMNRNAGEAILIRDGYVTEGAASNVFICSGGVIKTPVKNQYILPGITRDLLVELLAAANMDCRECTIAASELEKADEIWLTSSTQEISPVVMLDGRPVSEGVPGKLWHTATAIYQEFKRDFCNDKLKFSS